MTSLKDSSVGSAIKNLDLTLELEMPIRGPADSSNSSPSISLEPVSTLLEILQPPPSISGVFGKDSLHPSPLEETGNSPSPPTTGVPEMSPSG